MKNVLSKLIVVLIFIASLLQYSCKENTSAKENQIDEFLNYCFENNIFYGSVLVAEKGNVIYKDAFGYSNIETKEELTLNNSSCIGSVSKQLTSMAIMILKEQNKLSFEDKLSKYFSDFPSSNKISIRQLLNHTSGIFRYNNLSGLSNGNQLIDDLTNQDVFNALVEKDSLKFEPGEEYAYSNGAYVLLAMIVERVSVEPFHEFMKKNIFSPLGMNNTFVQNKYERDTLAKANGYYSLAEAYMKFGQNDLAIQNYEKALELNSDNANAKEMLYKLK